MDQEYDNDEVTVDESPAKGLRSQLEQTLADKKALESELAELRGKVREAEVLKVLSAHGVNPKIMKFIPSELKGDEIEGWLAENSDVFGGSQAPSENSVHAEPTVPDGERESLSRMQSLGQSAESPGKLAELESRMRTAETAEDLQQIWAEAQKFMM